MTSDASAALNYRFNTDCFKKDDKGTRDEHEPDLWAQLAARGSCRHFKSEKIDYSFVEKLCALSLSSPTKSDLQQRDIIIIDNPKTRRQVNALLCEGPLAQPWIADAPHLLVFCGNNRRQRVLHEMRGHPFNNDHLDAMFNAAVDAGVALSAFILAAEAIGLGCCPVSAIRNDAAKVSEILKLPDHCFPVAGLGLGWPQKKAEVSLRLPLETTVHSDQYSEEGLSEQISSYDQNREAVQPYAKQRYVNQFGTSDSYPWSEDKARQYSNPERETFGKFIEGKGFKLK